MGGKPEPTVTWFRDEKEITKSFKITITKTKEMYILKISGVTEKMSGIYKCVATNDVGKIEHSAQITVGEKPVEPIKKPEETQPIEEPKQLLNEMKEKTIEEPKLKEEVQPQEEPSTEEDPKLKKEPKPKEEPKPKDRPKSKEEPKPEEEPKPKEEDKPKPKPDIEAPSFIETFSETTVKPKGTLVLQAKVTGKPE